MNAMALTVIILIVGGLYHVSAADTPTLVYAPAELILSNPNNYNKNSMYSLTDLSTSHHWEFGMPTKLLFMNEYSDSDFYLHVEILRAIGDDAFIFIRYNCDIGPTKATNLSVLFAVKNPDSKQNTICYNPYNLTLHAEKSSIIPSGDNQTYNISVIKRLRMNGETNIRLEDTFRHSIKIFVQLWGIQRWAKDARPLYIRNWDSVFKFGVAPPGDSIANYFLKNDALMTMKESNPGGSEIATVSFINDLVVKAIKRGSMSVQASISIGAVLLFNAASCKDIRSDNSVAFMTDSYADHENFTDTIKVLRLNPLTGVLTYSRYGLSEVTKKVNAATKSTSKVKCSGTDCSRIHICARLQYTSLGGTSSYSRTEQSLTTDISHSSKHFGGTGPPASSCYELENNKEIKVFARAALAFIICPIICDQITETFKFYKGDVLMKPEPGRAFTRFGGLEIHQSGVMLRVTESVSHLESGGYSCTAGGQKVKLQLDVYGLPTFLIPNTDFIRGYLPRRIYAMGGDGFSVNCTAFHSGIKKVELIAMFQILRYDPDKKMNAWHQYNLTSFNKKLAATHTTVSWSLDRRTTYTAATYSTHSLPTINDGLPFNHRVTCRASTVTAEVKDFGIPAYQADSSSDVISINRPKIGDFSHKISACCLKSCTGSSSCQVEYTLAPKIMKKLAVADVKVCAAFRIGYSNLPKQYESAVIFDDSTGKLLWKSNKGIEDMMTDEDKFDFVSLVPVFTFFFPIDDDGLWPKVRILRRHGKLFIGAMACNAHPLCLYTTDNDYDLANALRVNTLFKIPVTVPESHRYVRIPEKLNLPNVPAIPPKWSATRVPSPPPPPVPDRAVNGSDISNALDVLKKAKQSKFGTLKARASLELVLSSVICLSVLMT